ncbi:Hypothetical predicted protein, partial [Podarcis lilfordi]
AKGSSSPGTEGGRTKRPARTLPCSPRYLAPRCRAPHSLGSCSRLFPTPAKAPSRRPKCSGCLLLLLLCPASSCLRAVRAKWSSHEGRGRERERGRGGGAETQPDPLDPSPPASSVPSPEEDPSGK